jgi:hypothetical protein
MSEKKVVIFVCLWLVIVNLFALVALNRFSVRPDTAYRWIDPAKVAQPQSWNFFELHARWDSNWYKSIVEHGYHYAGPGQLSNIVFFPLYPILVKAAGFLLLGNFLAAGWLVSALALVLAAVYLYRLAREFHKDIELFQVILFLLIFPTAFFFNAIYTEALFLLLSVATFYYVLKKNYWLAGLLGLAVALTRVTGVLLFLPLLWEYYSAQRGKLTAKQIASLLLIPLGTISFFLYHYLAFGDFFLFFKVESWWGRAFRPSMDHFLMLTQAASANFLLDSLFVVFALVATYFVWKRLRPSYALYMLLTILVALSTGTLMSIGRYIAVLFPIYLLGASIKNEYIKYSWILISTLLLAMNITLFVHYYWAG